LRHTGDSLCSGHIQGHRRRHRAQDARRAVSRYDARYANMKRWMNAINSLLDKGYMIFDHDNQLVEHKFEIDEDGRILQEISKNCHNIWYDPDPNSADCETTIAEWDAVFRQFRAIHPDHIKKLRKGKVRGD
jgi:hypothetical protein